MTPSESQGFGQKTDRKRTDILLDAGFQSLEKNKRSQCERLFSRAG